MNIAMLKTAGIAGGLGLVGAGMLGLGIEDLAHPDPNGINGAGAADVFMAGIGLLCAGGAVLTLKEGPGAQRALSAAAVGVGIIAGGVGGWNLSRSDKAD